MDTYSYTPSYPDSATSTPHSLEPAFENNPPPWGVEEQQTHKVKFMCSYGGKILPKPHDHQLSYIGGDTKIISIERNVKFELLSHKLASLCDEYEGVLIKYQLPDEDLDALISVTNDDDLENMLHEYDRLCKASNRPARLRLFLFPPSGGGADAISGGVTSAPVTQPKNNDKVVDFFGLEKELVAAPPVKQPHEEEVKIPAVVSDQILKHIEDLQRLKLEEQQGLLYRTKSDDGIGRERFSRPTVTGTGIAHSGSRPEKALPGGGRVYQTTSLGREQPVFMLSQPAPMMRPEPEFLYKGGEGADTNVSQGYYAVQRMPRPQPLPMQSVAVAPPVIQPQGPPNVGPLRYTEGISMVRNPSTEGISMMRPSSGVQYPNMVYDNMVGRQVYYNGPQGGQVMAGPPRTQAVSAPQYQPIAAGMLYAGGGAAAVPKATQGGSG
ncbi:hypothetical protein LIER_39614 [Lithospermum erythrorhizon]|uniref:PB1 domain-containing protein n=1 Tax=Lithospermum erythrorhizon TaxID=34254 RepID=A0AAV3QKH6_LITER